MAEVKRKNGETFESMLRRFQRRIIQSGRLLQAKKVRFRNPGKSKNARRESALRRLEVRARREYLIKTGKLREEDLTATRRRR